MEQNATARRGRAYLSEFSTNLIHLRNPGITAFWSAVDPGLGSLRQDRKIIGLILIIWGFLVNTSSHLNVAIGYTLTGHFEMAKHVVDTRWLLLYMAVYVFGVWDGYRGTVDVNKLYMLADREDAPITPFVIKTLDMNFLDKRNPWVAAAWSALTPGLGSLYVHKIIQGLFFIAWTIAVMYMSHMLQAVHLTMTGDFEQAKTILNFEWFLYLPGIYVFNIYDSYVAAVEYNKLFEKEQSKWIRCNHQPTSFKMPI